MTNKTESEISSTQTSADHLPEVLHALAEKITEKSRLKRAEKDRAYQTMLDELAKCISEGADEASILKGYQPPERRARRMRRDARRRRGVGWHLGIWSWRLYLLFTAWYIGFAIFLAMGKMQIVDFQEKRNLTIAAVLPEDRAWPSFRDCLIKYNMKSFDPMILENEVGLIHPGDPDWPALKKALLEYQAFIQEMHIVTQKKGFGLVLHSQLENYTEADKAFLFTEEQLIQDQTKPIVTIWDMGFDLSLYRQIFRLLRADSWVAIESKELDRAIKNIKTMSQLAMYLREFKTTITDMTAAGLHGAMTNTIKNLIYTHGSELTRSQLSALLSCILNKEYLFIPQTDSYQLYTDALVQSLYSEHGFINHKTLENLESIGGEPFPGIISSKLTMPFTALTGGTRKQVLASMEKLWQDVEQYGELPFWKQKETEIILVPTEHKRYYYMFMERLVAAMGMPAMDVMYELLGKCKGFHESTEILLHLELYRTDHSRYPWDLNELVPEYLSKIPLDHSTGKPLIYKLQDGIPRIYGRGLDQDDDGGKEIEDWDQPDSDGDWVLYPKEAIKPKAAPKTQAGGSLDQSTGQ